MSSNESWNEIFCRVLHFVLYNIIIPNITTSHSIVIDRLTTDMYEAAEETEIP